MATAGNRRQGRICLLLVKVGTPVAKAVFEKRVKDLTPTDHNPSPWTVDQFLFAKKPKMRSMNHRTFKTNWSKIFPLANLQFWDVVLLCTILIECCDLPQTISYYINQLKNLRNKCVHMSEPSFDDQKYQHYLMKFKMIFAKCLNEINDEPFTTEINRMVTDLEQGNFTQGDVDDVMQKLQSMQEEIGQNQRSINEKLDELLRIVAGFGTSILKVPESGAKIEIGYCSSETENNISELMVQCFEECIDSNGVELSECTLLTYAECKAAIHNMYRKLLSKGCKVKGVQKGCIFLHVQCSSLASLMSYFQDYSNGKLAFELKEVEDAIRKLDGCEDIALEIVINTEEILKTLDVIVSELMKTEGTLTQKPAEKTQADGKTTETDCADQGKTSHGNTAEPRRSSFGKRDLVKGAISHDANTPKSRHFILYAWLCVGIVVPVFISLIICHRAEIMWIHNEEYTKGFYKSASTETKEVSVDRYQRGIALVEIYRAQRKIAHYFELSYLLVADHPEQAKAIRRLANSARSEHLKTSALMKKYELYADTIVKTLLPMLSDAVCNHQSKRVVARILSTVIKKAKEMKTETEAVLQRYVGIQTEVQTHLGSVLSKSDKNVIEHARISAESVRDLQHLKVTAKETNEETQTNNGSVKISEKGMLGRMKRDEEILFLLVLSPYYTLCGRPAIDNLIAAGNVFTELFHSNVPRQYVLLLYGKLNQKKDEIARMHQQRTEELERFTLLKTNKIESDQENLNPLREANVHLRHTDEHFTRMIIFWSNMTAVLTFLRDESESGGIYLDEIGNPEVTERFVAYVDRAQKEWEAFGRICYDYGQESSVKIDSLYKFLSDSIDSMSPSKRARRHEEMLRTIEDDIENTYP